MHLRKLIVLNSLSFKILLAYVAGAALSIGLLVVFGTYAKERLPGMGLSERTLNLANRLTFDGSGVPVGFSAGDGHPSWLYDSLSEETAFRVLDADGNSVLESRGAEFWPDAGDISALKRDDFDFDFMRNGVLYESSMEVVEKNGNIWLVQLAVSSRIIDFLHEGFALPFIRLGVVAFSLVLLLVFGLSTYIILRYSLRPLRLASLAAAQISPKSLSERLRADGVPSEIAPLINSFNQALERLEKGYRTQREFLAKAAHELKTPLTLIRAEVELMESDTGTRESLLAHAEHLTRHVQQLLLLAEASEPLGYEFSDVDVYEVAHDAVFFLQKIADDKGINLTISGAHEGVSWRADRGAFFTLLKNLMENAIQHAPPGTEVTVEMNSNSICVRDRGAGVDQEQLSMLFLRFWRGAHRRDHGAGLGLAICREISLAHGWALSVHNERPGLTMKISRENKAGYR